MTREERLSLYETSLLDFKNDTVHAQTGFCNYYRYTHKIEVYNDLDFEERLPELFQQKPTGAFMYWWFDDENQSNRIKCLEKAIYITKTLLEADKMIDLNKSGYLGCMPGGMLVDRREHPEASPVQENEMFNIAKPKEL